jgi:hypothetical protein
MQRIQSHKWTDCMSCNSSLKPPFFGIRAGSQKCLSFETDENSEPDESDFLIPLESRLDAPASRGAGNFQKCLVRMAGPRQRCQLETNHSKYAGRML